MKLREWCYRKRLNISQFAELIGYDRTYIHNWMSGRKVPSKKAMADVWHFTMGKVKKLEDLRD